MTELKYEQAKTYEKEVFPLFREALKAAERQFESGQTSVLQLWQAFLSLNDANEEQLSLWVSAYGARTKLSLILGEE
jgi:outer membrane protein TolC